MDAALPLDDLRAKLRQDIDKLDKHLRGLAGAMRLETSPATELVSSALLKSNAQLLVLAAEQLLGDLEGLRRFGEHAAALAAAQSGSADIDALLQHNAGQMREALAQLNAENIS